MRSLLFWRYWVLISTFSMCLVTTNAQKVWVEEIELHGNTRTRDRVILRELDFAVGDSIPIQELANTLERNRNQVVNLGLFNEVEVTVHEWNVEAEKVLVRVDVREAWAIYPIPVVELADRNFNVWWEEYNGSLKRLNLGIYLKHINLTGNNDKLKLKGQVGYMPTFELEYTLPFFNRVQTLGFKSSFFHSSNKEINYLTTADKHEFIRQDDRFLYKKNLIRLDLFYRPDLYWYHDISLEFQTNRIDSIIGKELNPEFFGNARLRQKFFMLVYQMRYDKRDIKIFPTNGFYFGLELQKRGLGIYDDINTLEFYPSIELFKRFGYRWSVGGMMKAKISLIDERPPYNLYRGLGYGVDFLRGYELYVIDGRDFYFGKYTLKFLVVERLFDWGKIIPIAPFRLMPWQFYLSASFDAGYVNDPYYGDVNTFRNRWIYGWGPSASFVLYNNFGMHVQYSINHLGEKGVFLHSKLSF